MLRIVYRLSETWAYGKEKIRGAERNLPDIFGLCPRCQKKFSGETFQNCCRRGGGRSDYEKFLLDSIFPTKLTEFPTKFVPFIFIISQYCPTVKRILPDWLCLPNDVVEYVCFQRKESSVDPELCMQDYYYEIQLSRKYNHVTPLLRQLNWLPVDKLLHFRVLTYKCVNNLAPDYLCNKFRKKSSIHKRQTRMQDSKYHFSKLQLHGQRSFAYLYIELSKAVHIWNNLDKNLKDSASLKIFKTALKKHLVANENV